MRIWYDACTGKHLRYGAAISKRLKKKGHQIIFTTRKHPDTIPIARLLGEDPIVVGEYKPSSLSDRLEESSKRIVEFSKMFRDNPPDIAIAHQSVELCRTAFGLGIPIIPLIYVDLIKADKDGIKKFGTDYKKYMQKVPRANFIIGIIRALLNKRKQK